MNSNISVQEIFLHNQQIGSLANLPGDRNLFSFSQEYIDNNARPTLSLSFKDEAGNLLTDIKTTRTRLPPFFANLLPEGYMREYLASRANISSEREFNLFGALGNDLPGAIKTVGNLLAPNRGNKKPKSQAKENISDGALHFSLGGVQLKFSAIWDKQAKLTIPVDGIGGSWIVKLPSPSFTGVPQNEYAMMELARQIGIEVPETALIPLEQIKGLPKEMERLGSHAFVIKRFDRDQQGQAIHIEDFAQVFGVYPEKKYKAANYRNIAQVIWAEIGLEGLLEFIRRFIFNALIGNGDMHLKNWSLIYPDRRTPKLAPAYDFVSTLPYLPGDLLALNFNGSKAFNSLALDEFKRFAAKSKFPEKAITDTVLETVSLFAKAFDSAEGLDIEENVLEIISIHLQTIPLWNYR
ncbi:MAG: type II toxin-antitoxin system HipA family toxin [Candidatus Protochlamydia sp.]|nr:type II toxin-antitoxin system HipA family toxin [Candidatus Protochlamydia sp.]